MAIFFRTREKLGLTGIRERFNLVKHDPTKLERTLATIRMGRTEGQLAEVEALVERIVAMYHQAVSEFTGYGDSMWEWINELAAPTHAALMEGSIGEVGEMLNHPGTTNLFSGFDNPVVGPYGFVGTDRNLLSNELGPYAKERIYLSIRRLAEAIGAVDIANPETESGCFASPDDILDLIDEKIGVALPFPNFYPGEEGIETRRGFIGFRPLQAIYQAWRLRQLGVDNAVEIGAGLGRTAFYARTLGISRYTIIDIPLSRVAQAHFLGRALGEDQVGLAPDEARPVRILGPGFVEDTRETFDAVLNVDSLSEMDHAVAANYVAFARRVAPIFVSINREWEGAPRNAQLLGSTPATRYPYWMRDGYVEEIARFADLSDQRIGKS